MAKINLPTITGGYNLSTINSNFQKIEDALNDQVLFRDVPDGEPNQLVNPIDANGQEVYNLPPPTLDSEAANKKYVDDRTLETAQVIGYVNTAVNAANTATQKAAAAQSSANNAAASAVIAGQQANTAIQNANRAEDARDEALIAAESVGIYKIYDTYAQALADIASIPANGIVEVQDDETHGNTRSRYRKTGGSLVYLINMDRLRDDLISDGATKGDNLIRHVDEMTPAVPTFLPTVSDLINGLPVPAIRFGAVAAADKASATDQLEALQKAYDAARDYKRATIQLAAGVYGVSDSLFARKNTILRGMGMGVSTLYALDDEFIVVGLDFSDPDMSNVGYSGIENMTVWGYGDRNPTQGDYQRNIYLGRMAHSWVKDVESAYSRQMSVGVLSGYAEVTGCYVHHSFRDGINVTDSDGAALIGNRLEKIYDDSLAVHVRSSYPNGAALDKPVVIANNNVRKGFGIKVLGTNSAAIVGNNLRFTHGYGILVGNTGEIESFANPMGMVITGNVIQDVISLQHFSGGRVLCSGIILNGGARSLGAGLTTNPALMGDRTGGGIQTPQKYQHLWGQDIPKMGGFGNIIANNACVQTLLDPSKSTFTDFGFGTHWNVNGDYNFPFKGNVGINSALEGTGYYTNNNFGGITVNGAQTGLSITGNTVSGWGSGILFSDTYLQNVRVANNTITRGQGGVYFIGSGTARNVDVAVTSNNIDLDPFMEAPQRTQPLDGTWVTPFAGSDMRALFVSASYTGILFKYNSIKNVKSITNLSGNNTQHAIEDNDYYFDWSGGTWKGIGEPWAYEKNNAFFVDSNPTSSTYGQNISGGGAYVKSSNSVPTTGHFLAGQYVKYAGTPNIIGTNSILDGWKRRTNTNTGSEHTVGTDWLEVYVKATST